MIECGIASAMALAAWQRYERTSIFLVLWGCAIITGGTGMHSSTTHNHIVLCWWIMTKCLAMDHILMSRLNYTWCVCLCHSVAAVCCISFVIFWKTLFFSPWLNSIVIWNDVIQLWPELAKMRTDFLMPRVYVALLAAAFSFLFSVARLSLCSIKDRRQHYHKNWLQCLFKLIMATGFQHTHFSIGFGAVVVSLLRFRWHFQFQILCSWCVCVLWFSCIFYWIDFKIECMAHALFCLNIPHTHRRRRRCCLSSLYRHGIWTKRNI